ncbi:hypothetical protein ACHAWF_012159 [Thalassiosira exigua]
MMGFRRRAFQIQASQAIGPTLSNDLCPYLRGSCLSPIPGGGHRHRSYFDPAGKPRNVYAGSGYRGSGRHGMSNLSSAPAMTRTSQINFLRERAHTQSLSGAFKPEKRHNSNGSNGAKLASGSSGDGSMASELTPKSADPAATPPSTENQITRKRRRKSNYSPLAHMTRNHPKNLTPPSKNLTLTRKQILRLSPKQRELFYKQRLKEYRDSLSYLDKARINVRKNLKYLGDKADTNLKKNVKTMKRLLKGEEVWNDPEGPASKNQRLLSDLAKDIDWKRAPNEITANVRTNLATLQNWLHKTSNGLIPSSSYVGIHGKTSDAAKSGSVVTRVQQFHEMKQNNRLVMDSKWYWKNIAIALLPGTVLHLYFLSKQDEMKEYQAKLERMEREKVMGMVGDASGHDLTGYPSRGSERESGGGISFALIPEEGSPWERLKMTVYDLFLGGANERINQHRESQRQQEGGAGSKDAAAKFDSTSVSASDKPATAVTAKMDDPTVQMLLERIRSLEKQLGKEEEGMLSEEDLRKQEEVKRKKEHELNYEIKRLSQTPIQNRRDDMLRARWEEEESGKRDQAHITEEDKAEDAGEPSYSLASVANFAKNLLEPKFEPMRESAAQIIKEGEKVLGLSEGDKLVAVEGPHNRTTDDGTPSNKSNTADTNLDLGSTASEINPKDAEIMRPARDVRSADTADARSTDGEKESAESNADSRGVVRKWAAKLWQGIPKTLGRNRNDHSAEDQDDKTKP